MLVDRRRRRSTSTIDDSSIQQLEYPPALLEMSTSIVDVDRPATLEDSTGPVNTALQEW
jgi:hypothetical protein